MAEELDLGRSTTHRYATTLVTLGYLEQGPSRKYRLSSRVSDFGLSLLDSMVVRRVAREHLRELRARTGRTASLGVLGGAEVAYIDRWQGSRQGQYAVDEGIGLGTRLPIHCTAAGKALLARLPEAEQRSLISGAAPGAAHTQDDHHQDGAAGRARADPRRWRGDRGRGAARGPARDCRRGARQGGPSGRRCRAGGARSGIQPRGAARPARPQSNGHRSADRGGADMSAPKPPRPAPASGALASCR